MQKNIVKILLITVSTIITFIIQLCFLNNIPILGVKLNCVLICVIISCLALKSNATIPYAFVVGLMMDICFKFTIGPSTLSFLIIALVITIIKDMYNKYHIGFLFVVIFLSTFINEAISYVDSIIISKKYISVLLLFWIVIKSTIIHFAIAAIIKKVSDKILLKHKKDSAWEKGMREYNL